MAVENVQKEVTLPCGCSDIVDAQVREVLRHCATHRKSYVVKRVMVEASSHTFEEVNGKWGHLTYPAPPKPDEVVEDGQ